MNSRFTCRFSEIDLGSLFLSEGIVYRKMEKESAVMLRDREGRIANQAVVQWFFQQATVKPLLER